MVVALVVANVLGFVSLRVSGIAFAMVTLAFAQAGAVLALKDPHHWTHGEEGLGADYTKLPHAFVGIFNTKNLYWLALALPRLRLLRRPLGGRVVARARLAGDPRERAARRGARDAAAHRTSCRRSCSRRRSPPRAASSTCSSTTARRSASPQPNFTLTLLLMVVIGGAGSRWGAVLGGILYTYLNDRLIAIGSSSAVEGLPHALRTPLEQPLFLLGVIFILIVVFLPGGLAGLVEPRPADRAAAARGGGPSGRLRREAPPKPQETA